MFYMQANYQENQAVHATINETDPNYSEGMC